MSQTEDRYTAERWLVTASDDLRAARTLLDAEFYAHACFIAEQAGEKAVKALWYLIGEEPWGHSLQKLVTEFPGRPGLPNLPDWVEKAAALDRFYIPTRYPNGLPDLTPGQSYFRPDAEGAIVHAAYLLDQSRRWLDAYPQPGQPG